MTLKQFLDRWLLRSVEVERYKSGVIRDWAVFLQRINRELTQRLSGGELTAFKRGRLERQLKETQILLGQLFFEHRNQLLGELHELGVDESIITAGILHDAEIEAKALTEQQVIRLLNAQPVIMPQDTDTLVNVLKNWQTREQTRITAEIRKGYFLGETNQEIIRRIRGTKAAGYRDGVLAVVDRHISTAVRTSVQHLAAAARLETLKQSGVTQIKWVSTLDARTSIVCRHLDGQILNIEDGIAPPAHPNCRSTVVPWDERFAFLRKGATRSSENGYVDANLSYYDWLKQQPPSYQDKVLGVAKGRLFRTDGMTADRFKRLNLNKRFEPQTLSEMRKQAPEAFKQIFNEAPVTKQAIKATLDDTQASMIAREWMGDRHYRQVVGELQNPRIKKLMNEYGLTQAEGAAIRYYTQTGYSDLNNHLYGNHARPDLDSAADLLRQALAKLPDYEGTVVRRTALPKNVFDQHVIGNVVEYKAFTSTTRGVDDVMEDYPHRLRIDTKSGKDINWISEYYNDEYEVLLTSPTKFIITGRRILRDGTVEIKMSEK